MNYVFAGRGDLYNNVVFFHEIQFIGNIVGYLKVIEYNAFYWMSLLEALFKSYYTFPSEINLSVL